MLNSVYLFATFSNLWLPNIYVPCGPQREKFARPCYRNYVCCCHVSVFLHNFSANFCLQCFVTVGLVTGMASSL